MFPGNARFSLLEALGSGAMGVVYRVHDLETGTEVALKTLRSRDPTEPYLLKQEFRSLADIRHPGLVELYELFIGDQDCFFTMELVQGATFVQDLRKSVFDESRFADAVVQLTHALHAIHAAGKLHRDVKPSNVLVTQAGRVVVLDFGLVTAFRGPSAGDTVAGMLAGTPAYMAPEQAQGAPPAPPADWYAVGVMLYEAITGHLPFDRPLAQMLLTKGKGPPPGPRARVPELPERLDTLVTALLDPDPARRPGAPEILAAVHPGLRISGVPKLLPPREPDETVFVDRERETAALEAAFHGLRGSPVPVLVHGESGIGKTSLIARFLERLGAETNALVLTGRCHPNETVPYKGFDALIDRLSRLLLQASDAEMNRLVPRYTSALTRVFPVLARVPELSDPIGVDPGAEPHEIRRRGFLALRELLTRIADRRPLILWIDDAQWGGADSAALLQELLRPPDAVPALVILSHRMEGTERAPMLEACLRDDRSAVEIAVGPLDNDARLALARAVTSVPEVDIESLVAESEGSPFLITQLANLDAAHHVVRLRDVLRDRVQQLPNGARAVLEVVSVAGSPIDRGVVLDAAGVGEAGRPLVAALHRERLLRIVGIDPPTVETYHDQVRERVVAALSPDALAGRHRSIARVLEARGVVDPARLAEHLFAAGELEQASVLAVAAGDRAVAALAFVHAARFYRCAREWWPGDRVRERDLCIREAEALVNAGRCAGAAALFLSASTKSAPGLALALRRRAVEQFLAGGHIDDGMAVLVPLLHELGLGYPATPRHAILRATWWLIRLRLRGTRFGRRVEEEVPTRDLLRIDVCYSAAKSFSIIDPARGIHFSVLGLLLALRAGEPVRVGRSLALVGGALRALGGGPMGRWGHRLMDEAVRLADRENDTYLTGAAATSLGPVYVVTGEWAKALERADHGVRLLTDRCRGVSFECAIGRMAALRALEELGRMSEVRVRAEEMLAGARATGDRYAEVTASLNAAFALLANDDPSGARSLVRQALGQWTREAFHIQHLYAVRIEAYCDLYEGRPEAARARVLAAWPALEASFLLRIPVSRVDALLLRARSALALAVNDPAFLPSCQTDATRLGGESRADAAGHALIIRAAIAALQQDRVNAMQLAERAAETYRRADMALHALCAERRWIEFAGATGDVAEIDRRITACGVTNPQRWVEIYAPGFRAVTAEA